MLRMNSKLLQRRHSKLLTDNVEPKRPSKNKGALLRANMIAPVSRQVLCNTLQFLTCVFSF